MNKIVFLLLTLASANFALASKINVVTSIQTLASLTEEVGGDKVDVISLSKGYMDPHFVEAKPSLVLSLHKADLLVHVGLELEIGWLPPLVLGSRNANIKAGTDGNLDSSSVVHILKVPTVKVDRSMGDIHPQGNPHFWIPPKNARLIARAIAERLKRIQPENSSYFDDQYKKFDKKISDKEKDLASKIKKFSGFKVVPYHDSWAYVSEWLGLKEVGFIEIKPGVPPDPQHLVDIIRLMQSEKAKAILMENFYNRDIAKSVAEKSGAILLEMPSDVGASDKIKNYFDLVDAVVNKLSEAL